MLGIGNYVNSNGVGLGFIGPWAAATPEAREQAFAALPSVDPSAPVAIRGRSKWTDDLKKWLPLILTGAVVLVGGVLLATRRRR